MPLDHDRTIQMAREQGLLDEYENSMALIIDAAEVEDTNPRRALALYSEANRILEDSGALSGPHHALFNLHAGAIYRKGELIRRTGVSS